MFAASAVGSEGAYARGGWLVVTVGKQNKRNLRPGQERRGGGGRVKEAELMPWTGGERRRRAQG